MDKILTLYIDLNRTHPDVVNPVIFIYKGYQLPLDKNDQERLIASLPEFWNTEQDQLHLFTVLSDGSYYCERQKTVYNYANKLFEKVPYVFDAADKEKSDEFINFLSAFFQEVRVKQQNDLQQNILISLSNTSLTQTFILNTRKNILSKTDYLFIGDYPISEDQKSKWAEYRQAWRDITKQEAWKTDEIYKLNFPISPAEKDDFTFQIMQEMGQGDPLISKYVESIKEDPDYAQKSADLINRYCEYMFKSNIISSLSRFKLPMFDLKFSNTFDMNEPPINFMEEFSQFVERVDEQLKTISEELSISSIIAYYRNINGNSNLTQEVIDILEELQNTSEGEQE